MANFVVSVEHVQATLTAAGQTTVNLSKGQDEDQCVPFYTHKFTVDGSDNRHNNAASLTMVDNGGTPAVQVDWFPISTSGTIVLEIFVVEYGSNVKIQTGLVSLTDAGSTGTDTITEVVLDNAFIHFTMEAVGSANDDFEDACIQASFNSTTEVQFERHNVGPPEWDIRYYVVESDGTDFTTEYVEASWAITEKGPAAHSIDAVTLAKAFLICTYQVDEAQDDARDAIVNFALTTTTELTFYRDGGFNPSAVGTFGVWVVKTSGTEFSVQRIVADVDDGSSTTFTEEINEVDSDDKAIILHSQGELAAAFPMSNVRDGNLVDNLTHSLVFTSDTEVTLSRLDQTAIESDSGGDVIRFEVVEFELEAAGGVIDLHGDIDGASEVQGALGRLFAGFHGDIDGLSEVQGAMNSNPGLHGNVDGVTNVEGTLGISISVSGEVITTGLSEGAMDAQQGLHGEILSTTAIQGALGRLFAGLHGTITGTSEVQGALGRLFAGLYGDVITTSQVEGVLNVLRGIYGDVIATSLVEGAIGIAKNLSGQISGLSEVQSAMDAQSGLHGEVPTEAAIEAAMDAQQGLHGAVSGTSLVEGALGRVFAGMAGEIQGESALEGSLRLINGLYGQIIADAVAEGAIGISKDIAGTSAGTSAVEGFLRNINGLHGTVAGIGALSAHLNVQIGLRGDINGTCLVEGNLEVISEEVIVEMAGTSAGISNLDSFLGILRSLHGDIDGTMTTDAFLGLLNGLHGIIAGTADAEAALGMSMGLAGEIIGSSEVQAFLGLIRDLHGDITCTSDVNGAMTLVIDMAGTSLGQSDVEGALALVTGLTGNIDSVASVLGALGTIRGLFGTIPCTVTVEGALANQIGLAGDIDAVAELAAALEVQLTVGSAGNISIFDFKAFDFVIRDFPATVIRPSNHPAFEMGLSYA